MLLEEAEGLVSAQGDPQQRGELLLRIARLRQAIGDDSTAPSLLGKAVQAAREIEPEEARATLLLRLYLACEAIGETEQAEELRADTRPLLEPADERADDSFPFPDSPLSLSAGAGLSGSSYIDTTAEASVNVTLYKPWSRQDIYVDALALLGYDSSRSVNTFRPNGLATLVGRHHLSPRWSLALDQLLAVNNDSFASETDDEDLSIISSTWLGVGRNLWRGESTGSFVDLQFAAGVRFLYDYLDFREERNQIDPVVGVILVGRDIPLGSANLSQILAIGTDVNKDIDVFAFSDTSLNLPINKRWSWTNRVVLRFSETTLRANEPNLNLQFLTGLRYSLAP